MLRFVLPLLIAAFAPVGFAQAQSPNTTTSRDAELFAEGVAAVVDQRFADARDLLREALELAPRAPTAFNLAVALRGTGEVSEGVAVLDALRSGAYGEISEEQLAQVNELRSELMPEIAQLRVSLDVGLDAELRIDTDEHPLNTFVRLDPSAHVVEIAAEGYEPLVERVELERGEQRTLAPVLEPLRTGRSFAWLWVLTGVVVAGGAALALGLALRADPLPVQDAVFGNTEALSWR